MLGLTSCTHGCSEVRTVDCVSKEELVASSRLTIVINAHREVCAIQKMGGTELLPEQVCLLCPVVHAFLLYLIGWCVDSSVLCGVQIVECVRIAHVKAVEHLDIIDAALKTDSDARYHTSTLHIAHACMHASMTLCSCRQSAVWTRENLKKITSFASKPSPLTLPPTPTPRTALISLRHTTPVSSFSLQFFLLLQCLPRQM
jgi:hypothetical protein